MAGSPTDAELVALCRTGDDGAWTLLVERYARYVNAILARAYRLESHVAEDTFQDVFERVYEQLPKLRDDDSFGPGSRSSHGAWRSTRCEQARASVRPPASTSSRTSTPTT